MPSIVCSQCKFPVTYLEDLVGSVQCPSCGEELLRGNTVATTQTTPDLPGLPVRDDDPPARSEVSPRRLRSDDVDYRSPRRDEISNPDGIATVATIWILCGMIGLLLNAGLLILYVAQSTAEGGAGLRLSSQHFGFYAVLVDGALLLYVTLLVVGSGLQGGSQRETQIPAWFVLFVATGCLLYNTVIALGSGTTLSVVGQMPRMSPEMESVRTAALVNLIVGVLLVLIDLLLIASSMVLLWQSASYAHRVRTNTMPPTGRKGSSTEGMPGGIRFAGLLWVVIGLVSIVMLVTVMAQMYPSEVDRGSAPLGLWLIPAVEMVLIPLVTTFYLGLLLLNGRLQSTGLVGLLFLVMALHSLAWMLFQCWGAGGFDGMLASSSGDAYSRGVLVLSFVLNGLAILASLFCLAGNESYQDWLRQSRGLTV